MKGVLCGFSLIAPDKKYKELRITSSPRILSQNSEEKYIMNSTQSEALMEAISSLAFTIFFFIYLICWLGYLVYQHYGSAKAAHIFELNILLDYVLFTGSLTFQCFLILISADSGLLCSIMMIIQHVTTLCYFADIAGSHLDTLMFLKESFKAYKK